MMEMTGKEVGHLRGIFWCTLDHVIVRISDNNNWCNSLKKSKVNKLYEVGYMSLDKLNSSVLFKLEYRLPEEFLR